MGSDAVEVEQLLEPQPQRGADLRVQPPFRVLGDDPVQRALALDDAEHEPLGERPLARLEVLGLRAQRAIGVGTLFEDAAHHPQGGRAGWRDR